MTTWSSAPTRGVPRQRPVNVWPVAVVAYLLGVAVLLGLGFVLGMAGLVVMFAMGFTGTADGLTRSDLTGVVLTVAIGLAILSVFVQVRYIRSKGGARPVAAPVTALAANAVLGFVTAPLALPMVVLVVLQSVVEISVLGALIKPRR